MPRHHIEPHADVREMAATWRQIFVACREQDFSISQSMDLLKTFISNIRTEDDTPDDPTQD